MWPAEGQRFRLTPKFTLDGRRYCWQMACFHPLHVDPNHPKSTCSHSRSFKTSEEEELALRCLKHWALEGLLLESRQSHQRDLDQRPSASSIPSMAELDALAVLEFPPLPAECASGVGVQEPKRHKRGK